MDCSLGFLLLNKLGCLLWSFVFYKIFLTGDKLGLQAGFFSTWTPLLMSHAVGTHTQNVVLSSRQHVLLKPFYFVQTQWHLSKCAGYLFFMHSCNPTPSQMLTFELYEQERFPLHLQSILNELSFQRRWRCFCIRFHLCMAELPVD